MYDYLWIISCKYVVAIMLKEVFSLSVICNTPCYVSQMSLHIFIIL